MSAPADPAVAGLETAVYTVPTDRPSGDGTLTWDSTTMVLVRATGGGLEGLGWTYGPPACASIVRDLLVPHVEGRPALDVPAALEAMVRAVRNAGRPGAAGYAVSAVETALWDLKARLLGLPLHRLLGAVRDAAPLYGSGGLTTYDDADLRAQLARWVHDEGFKRVKIKIGESWGRREDRDLARLRLAREVIGPGAELYADANGGYTAKQAVRVGGPMSELGVRWFEEPVSSDDLAGLRLVREALAIDVAAGEYGFDLPYFQRMCAAGSVDCLQIDVTRCGGILEFQRAATVAAAHGLEVSGHCAPFLHRHVAMAVPGLRHLEWFHDHVRIETLFFDGAAPPSDGRLRPDPDRPGHGLALKAADAAPYRTG
ncbi:L-alanine-DL-glutamate epimerase-like enolase superfamily enzyme [Spinactinospora alkalitolerans]|uniref:L-alanine-DL-glutamate epimerase-like enolase superfamily enzyme n=1 Tax=Spinactinospora alkalitolerans TaxID=687207 RepID=A0A852U1V3_9ACTN|nr:enolase C-terminal domain-like protein [Spinactinospora alkalitolerans]NYE48144.1 L-alanine-DL-glutamate epimerase-like enolase superfamily enzyme [Spinactinospora alkalitolerans]